MKEMKLGVYTHNDETHNFNFTTNLSAHDKTVFVRTIVETLVDDANYDSVLREIIFDYVIISKFTDIDTSFLNTVNDEGDLITDINLIEQFLKETNVVDIVKANMDDGLLYELNKAVDKSIEYRTGIHPNPLNEALASLLSTLEKKINDVDLSAMVEMAQVFSGVTDDFTLENIVNAYMNTDLHKKNLIEIDESKKKRAKIAKDIDKTIKSVDK